MEGIIMAYFDDNIECMNKKYKQVRVPSNKGGSDRNIYVNGNNSGYYLGKNNDTIYHCGKEVSTAPIRDFVKQNL
jgi:hypothetical protein